MKSILLLIMSTAIVAGVSASDTGGGKKEAWREMARANMEEVRERRKKAKEQQEQKEMNAATSAISLSKDSVGVEKELYLLREKINKSRPEDRENRKTLKKAKRGGE